MIFWGSFFKLTLFFLFTFFLSLSHSSSGEEDADDEAELASFQRKRSTDWPFSAPASRRPSLQHPVSRALSLEGDRVEPYGLAQIILENSHFKSLEDIGVLTQTVLFLQQTHSDPDVRTILNLGADYCRHFDETLSAKTVSDILLTLGALDTRYSQGTCHSSINAYRLMMDHFKEDRGKLSTLQNQTSYLHQAAKVLKQTVGNQDLAQKILRCSLEWTQGLPEESEDSTTLITQIALAHPRTWGSMMTKELHETFDYTLEEATDYLNRTMIASKRHAPRPKTTPLKRLEPGPYPKDAHQKLSVDPQPAQADSYPGHSKKSPSVSSSSSEPRKKETPDSDDVFYSDDEA